MIILIEESVVLRVDKDIFSDTDFFYLSLELEIQREYQK